MRRPRWISKLPAGALLPLLLGAVACGDGSGGDGVIDAPDQPDGPPTAPVAPPPTGSKWAGTEVEDACGRVKLAYVLIDETCGGTDDPHYMDYFHAPIMRDGAQIGDHLFAVDATNLWVLNVAQADEPERAALLAGFGQPMAVAIHGGRLLIAAGDAGLLLIDVTNPASPLRLSEVELDGPALDVWIEGDVAYVAAGAAGIAVIDIAQDELSLRTTLPAPGFAAAVAARGGVAYVAACDTFAAIDVDTGATLGATWLADAYQDDILVAPAKDVSLSGDTAFVAAGRYGAVAVDVANPAALSLLGNCTLAAEQSFYASGVRDFNGTLYVAGGEYGILPIGLGDPSTTCASFDVPALPPPPEEEDCTVQPPWEVLPWTETWVPPPVPPEGRDPLQTFITNDRLYAFGDATRIGVRAIDVRNPVNIEEKLGRYSEPRLTEGIAAQGNRVLVAGKAGGLFTLTDGGLTKVEDLQAAKLSRAAAFLGDGRWVFGGVSPQTGGGVVYVEGELDALDFEAQIWAGGLAAKASTVYVPFAAGVEARDLDSSSITFYTSREAQLPQSIAVGDDHLVVASPEWTSAVRVDGLGAASLPPVAAFGDDEIGNVGLWRRALPRRTVLTGALGQVEVASLGGEAGLTFHGQFGPISIELPPGDYISATFAGDRVFAVAVDRGRYRTQLVTIELGSGEPVLGSTFGFAGSASGVASSEGHLFVADGDRGVRVYDVSAPTPVLSHILELSAEAP
ncbi:MAG: hypothetical protein IPM79_01305 [Polyangiaceae bacterium]|jgi:hypothetical protein|nr:hypothetical protein [Polyangiaceae bacterium]MBK8936308.1 hypothetical protein [Polyangiaceae bacterium]